MAYQLVSPRMSQSMSLLTSHKSTDWFTPRLYILMVIEVIGPIDLDPASAPKPQGWIKAARYWRTRGLERPWKAGRVFCNPPYGKDAGKSSQAQWSQKMAREFNCGNFKEGILLINSTHGYEWYERVWRAHPVCLVRHRIRFLRDDGMTPGPAKRGQTFVYFGKRPERFAEIFRRIGRVLTPDQK